MNFKLDMINEKNYTLSKCTKIEEINSNVYELIHNNTKAKIVLFENEEENRVFNIVFKTPVNNSKGTPHILEHSVLCGSRKYNVKDPFIELAKSSMNTFLNAMTYPDKTCYPIASANLKDYKNLTDVYLDSVFFPNIYKNKNIFLQEGWHYEVADDKLTVNGVVLNEMRGVYSDKNEILSDLIFNSLYNNTNYAYAYGGDPKEIIDLSYEEFLNFHKRYYNHTNDIIFFYGKLDFNERLQYLHNEYLSKFSFDKKNIIDFNDYYDIDNLIKSKDGKIIESNGFYNVDTLTDDKEVDVLSYNFIINNKKNILDDILMNILDYILFRQEGAIIKEELIKNKLGQSIQTMFEQALYQPLYSIQSFNIDKTKKEEFIRCIDESINNILEKGIDKEKFEAGLSAIYYEYLDINDNQSKGISITLKCLETYLYGEDISISLKYKEAFDDIKKMNLDDLECRVYSLLREVFVDNEHKNIVAISPKVNLLNDYNNELKKIIDARKNSMEETEYKETIEEAINLKKYQESSDDDYSCLPKLLLSDIEKYKRILDYDILNIANNDVVVTNKSIDDLVYIGLNIKLEDYNDLEIYMLGIMLKLLTRIDTIDYDYKSLNNQIDLYTGLFDKSIVAYDEKLYIRFNLKTIVNNLDETFDLLYKVIFTSIYENKNRIFEILNEIKSDSISNILSSGHLVALNRAMAGVSKASNIIDMTKSTGIAFNMFLNELIKNYNDNWLMISNNLKYITKKVFDKNNFTFDVCLNNANIDKFSKSLKKFIDKLNNTLDARSYKLEELFDVSSFKRSSSQEAFLTIADVNYVSRVGVFKKEHYNGSMLVLATLFNYDYLWNNIRVLGGAYGCAAKFQRMGTAGFTTYRDPNLIKSDECFKNSITYLESLDNQKIDIDKLIVSTIAKIDNPLNAFNSHELNVIYYFCGQDNDYINIIRQQILSANVDTLKEISNQLVDIINSNQICALVAEKSAEEAKSYYKTVKKLDLI